jgi:hypothetical protein
VWSLFGHVCFNFTTLFFGSFRRKRIFYETTIIWMVAVEGGLMHRGLGCWEM